MAVVMPHGQLNTEIHPEAQAPCCQASALSLMCCCLIFTSASRIVTVALVQHFNECDISHPCVMRPAQWPKFALYTKENVMSGVICTCTEGPQYLCYFLVPIGLKCLWASQGGNNSKNDHLLNVQYVPLTVLSTSHDCLI